MLIAEMLPEKTIRKLETLFEAGSVKTEPAKTKEDIAEALARDPFFYESVWKGRDREVRNIVKNALRRNNLRARKDFRRIYLKATRIVAMLDRAKPGEAAVAG